LKARRIWAGCFAAALFALSSAAIAVASPIVFVVEPTYTFCMSGTSRCSPIGRTTLAAEYKPLVTKRLDIRLRLSRGYVRSTDEGTDESTNLSTNQGFQSTADSLALRVRLFDDLGFQRSEPRAGYTYQYAAGSSPPYHTVYASDAWFFGRRIRRGTEAPAREFRLFLKVSENRYVSSDLPQTFVQIGPYATFPFNSSGSWRADVGYTFQQQFAGSGTLKQPSNRLLAGVTHDFSFAVRAYVRFESTSSSDALITGVKVSL
jgi:hypothetical protein